MRVICFVPSLTETLIECGVAVVGRTRFCIHPADKVKDIAKVGGTKGVDWEKCQELEPDLVVFDQEENLKEMADNCPFPWHATHVTSVDTIAAELEKLARRIDSRELLTMANKWQSLASSAPLESVDWNNIPGQISLLNNSNDEYKRIEYVIWREPWMAVGKQTFIASMLNKLGFETYLIDHENSYPELTQAQMQYEDTFYLFSSEPYPFARHRQSLIDAGFQGAIVDGEVYSWFGIRSYKALLEHLSAEKG